MATEIIQTADMPTVSFAEQYGSDIGKQKSTKAISAIGGAALGGIIGKKIGDSHFVQSGNPLATIAGSLIGSVVAYKVIPEVATDIQRGNQYVDQQVRNKQSAGSIADRFKAVMQNVVTLRGQKNTPTTDINYEM